MEGSMKCKAKYVPLTPICFLERAAAVYGDRQSVIVGSQLTFTWSQTRERCHKLASALVHAGVSRGDVVAVISLNTPAVYELHFAVPMAGAVVCVITPHCTHDLLADLVHRSNAKLVFVDHACLDLAQAALRLRSLQQPCAPLVVAIAEAGVLAPIGSFADYEAFLISGDPRLPVQWPEDEFDAISISYTSGTTGVPKGVIHTHRVAFLNTLATILLMEMQPAPVFLWTVPMYHCNGWGFVWAVAAQGGTNVFPSEMSARAVFDAIAKHGVTALGGATPVLSMMASAPLEERRPLPHRVDVLAGGAPPPPDMILRMEEMGFRVTHAGGQTETYGCAIYSVRQPEWEMLPGKARAQLQARQGLPHLLLAQVDVKDPATMASVPADGETVGEVVYMGNNVMKGYLDRETTNRAFRGGWFHSGDLGVRHPDYVEFKDRLLDMVVRGGRTVGTIEIENLLYEHPAVKAAGVVGWAEEQEGGPEMLFAFVELKEFCAATEEILEFCRARLPEDMVPDAVAFEKIPVTSTGKTRKAALRQMVNTMFAAAGTCSGNFENNSGAKTAVEDEGGQ